MWNLCSMHDMITLITQLPYINFHNIDWPTNPFDIPVISIDKKCSIVYPHIKFDISARTPYKHNGDIFTTLPAKYAAEKYLCRLRRWADSKANPLFVIAEDKKWRPEAITIQEIDSWLPELESALYDTYIFTFTRKIEYLPTNKHIKLIYVGKKLRPHELATYILSNHILSV